MSDLDPRSDRRRFLQVLAAVPILFTVRASLGWLEQLAPNQAFAGASPDTGSRSARSKVTPTPECDDDDEPTPPEIEGPFFKLRSPRRRSLIEDGVVGTKIVLVGRVFSRACRPIPGALLDFWHADRDGEYDNVGFKLRGHQFADQQGRFRLETIVPGQYGGRTRHIHVKVQAPHERMLTTQLYFPGEHSNQRDGLFRPELLIAVRHAPVAKQARFNFVLDMD